MTSARIEPPPIFDGGPPTRIVVPVGADLPDERDTMVAAAYGEHWQLPVRLVHVDTGGGTGDGTVIRSALATARPAHPDLDLDGEEVVAATVAEGLLDAADERSLMVVATNRSSQWVEKGSVAEAVLAASDQLVMLCGPRCQDPPVGGSVIVPLDTSARAETALGPAVALAKSAGVMLWLVSVVSLETVEAIAELRARGEAVTESSYLRAVADRLAADGIDVGWEVVHGDDAVASLAAFAANQGSSLIVATTHGDTGVAKRLFGSVCLGLVEQGPIPVVVVKTEQPDPEPLLAG